MFNRTVSLDPRKFYAIARVIQDSAKNLDAADDLINAEYALQDRYNYIESQRTTLASANNSIIQEIRLATKVNPFASIDEQEQSFNKFSNTLDGKNFLRMAFNCVNAIGAAYQIIIDICKDLRPGELLLSGIGEMPKEFNFEKLQQMTFEAQINEGAVQRFVSAIYALDEAKYNIAVKIGENIISNLDSYYQTLLKRHTSDGVKIFRDPVITDLAISIFENIDAHGEIESGKTPDEISAYSLRKAEVIVDAIKKPEVFAFINTPESLINYLSNEIISLWNAVGELEISFKDTISKVMEATGSRNKKRTDRTELNYTVQRIKDLNPSAIIEKEPTRLLNSEEKFYIQFKNETLSEIVRLLTGSSTVPDLIRYILDRKAKLHTYFQNENSFYVCRIGAGNSFIGEAPGALTVVPGAKPHVTLDDIVGGGFQELKQFVAEVEASAQWHDLFVATSPSKTADKANVLLIGPQGCGKTEALRAVASDRKSIGVFAQGSDFLTCWKGEAEKNPKRLFEAAVKLQKESKRHVHILIDEIDSVLKKQELTQHGEFNLTLEFQILMDGLVHYRGISVWGTTNHPERLPMPMLRRFSKVLIVGELDEDQRVQLLKHFVGFMPSSDFNDREWRALSSKLEGATGDVIRKVIDYVWRSKMTWFVQNHKEEAIKLLDMLNQDEKFDIAHFDNKRRATFQNKLSGFVSVKPIDIERSIEEHLKNVAIYNEIQTAKKTYKEAREFLTAVSGSKLII